MEVWLREGKRRLLSLLHQIAMWVECRMVEEKLKVFTADCVKNQPVKAPVRSVLFVVTRMVRFHGGQTSVLRLGTALAKRGFSVGYAVYKPQSRQEMALCAKSNFPEFCGALYPAAELRALLKSRKRCPDVMIATSWDTVSFVKRAQSYRMYFVQDFEPYFYRFGELFLLAKKTYEQGLHMVSLGAWNAEMIETHCHRESPLAVVDFPCARSVYETASPRRFSLYAEKRRLVMAVYLKYYGKRLPCILQHMLCELKALFAAEGKELVVYYFGEAKSFRPKGGENLGMLTAQELKALYERADFGMTASLSNISLVPYEMLAAGLPLIEFADGTFPYFFQEDCAILTAPDARELYQKLTEAMRQPEEMEARQERAARQLAKADWERTGEQFAQILRALPEETA